VGVFEGVWRSPGAGATFFFGDDKPSKKKNSSRAGADDDAVSRLRGLTILLVDDFEDTRTLYQQYFEWLGLRMTTAEDGAAALRSVLREKPDVVVLDLAMPKLTGWEVLKSLKGNPATQHIPILVLSGQQERQSAITAGADSYCEKPCLPDALVREVHHLVVKFGRRP
jgi:CheY-like chemotaxis protein